MAPSLLPTSGIETLGPAVLFAVLYVFLTFLYVWQTARSPAYAFIALGLFCIFRVVGFILRAILAASDGAKQNGGLVITETVFINLGFVGLLYSVFMLIVERRVAARQLLGEDESQDQTSSEMLNFILSRGITNMTFTAAFGVSIAAAAHLTGNPNLSERLRKVAIILYLELTANLSVQAGILVYKERKVLRLGLRQHAVVGQQHAVFILCLILTLLLIRQAYLLATFNSDKQNNESLWYLLIATPEFLAACLFSTTGLVPYPEELSEEDKKRSYWSRLWKAYNTSV